MPTFLAQEKKVADLAASIIQCLLAFQDAGSKNDVEQLSTLLPGSLTTWCQSYFVMLARHVWREGPSSLCFYPHNSVRFLSRAHLEATEIDLDRVRVPLFAEAVPPR